MDIIKKIFKIPSRDLEGRDDFVVFWNKSYKYYWFELETIRRWDNWEQEKKYLMDIKMKFQNFILKNKSIDVDIISKQCGLNLLLQDGNYKSIEDLWMVFDFILDAYIEKGEKKNGQID